MTGWQGAYLCSGGFEALPVDPRQDVGDEGEVEIDFLLLELSVAEVEGKGLRRRLAGFDGAGEEVDREDLHLRRDRVFWRG